MKVSQIDPRDERWQDIGPVFRVYFWQKLGETSYVLDEFEICDADVIDVLRWAERERGDRTFTLYLRRDEASGLGLVLLAGTDPTAK